MLRDNKKIIHLIWEDAVKKDEAWSTMEEIEDWNKNTADGTINQVCIVLKETKEFLIVASRWDGHATDPCYGFVHRIPKTWIRQRKVLR